MAGFSDTLGSPSGPYGKGYPRGKKTAAGHTPCGQATPQTAVRPFGGWPTHRAYKGRAWRARMKFRESVDTLPVRAWSPWPTLAIQPCRQAKDVGGELNN
jgi:hypothetical protein